MSHAVGVLEAGGARLAEEVALAAVWNIDGAFTQRSIFVSKAPIL